jgi:hypothetical protein
MTGAAYFTFNKVKLDEESARIPDFGPGFVSQISTKDR